MIVTRRVVRQEEGVTKIINDSSVKRTWKKWITHEKKERKIRIKHEQNRLDSYNKFWWDHVRLDISVARCLAKAGFYRTFSHTGCFSCGLRKSLSFWKLGYDPERVHCKESPYCNFLNGQSDNFTIKEEPRRGNSKSQSIFPSAQRENENVTYLATVEKEQQNVTTGCTDPPKHPDFALESDRLSTFRTCGVQSPEFLCKAGFYYTGEKDIVRCFDCGGSLCHWDHTHNPFIQHARWYPNCPFIRSFQLGKGTEVGEHDNQNTLESATSVKPTLPSNTGEILLSLIKDKQETERRTLETGRKLRLLMYAVESSCSGALFLGYSAVPFNAISTLQQTPSAQGLLQGVDHVMYNQQMTMVPPTVEVLRRAEQTVRVTEHRKILKRVSGVIASWKEVDTFGFWWGCDPNDVRRLRNTNHSIKDAAYQILYSFYESVPNEERWGILIETLREMKKYATVKELKLEEFQQNV